MSNGGFAHARKLMDESERAERGLIQHYHDSPLLFCIVHRLGLFQYTNPAWEKVLGWSRAELATRIWTSLFSPDDSENLMLAMIDMEKREGEDIVMQLRHHDGHYVPIRWNMSRWGICQVAYLQGEPLTPPEGTDNG